LSEGTHSAIDAIDHAMAVPAESSIRGPTSVLRRAP